MKKLILLLLFITTSICYSQKIKIKKNKVLVDKKEYMQCEKENTYETFGIYLSELNSDEQKIKITIHSNETHMYLDDDYAKISFLTKGTQAEIKSRSLKNMVKLLIKNKVLTSDGKIDEEKIELFIKNYDENITNRTIRN
ncbi:hypothetical protein SAMN04489761_3054 [Tenacibaculum sp. MAR_2009_124]|uniref:hypothetical protein n=1 Tax=Tenacibaculum sp. MAR_2009_124 TaxID=1250059 RepID=UPI000895BD4C|nr:hypothetical protein [Tenacibaculum sp. MAR_2009_124]SEC46002.1 hypothetical protein SAMN04489761_3054 [Tenacibaculum sp. MAR_2009_124]